MSQMSGSPYAGATCGTPVTTAFYDSGNNGLFDTSHLFPTIYSKFSGMNEMGKMDMNHNNIHIQPMNNGFMVTIASKDEGISNYCFSEFDDVVKFLGTLTVMDIDSEAVANNV